MLFSHARSQTACVTQYVHANLTHLFLQCVVCWKSDGFLNCLFVALATLVLVKLSGGILPVREAS